MIVEKDKAPKWMHYKYIGKGYRIQHTFKQLFKSVGKLHNEFMNIWTHFMAAIFLLAMLLDFIRESHLDNWRILQMPVKISPFISFFIASILGFLCSTIYHTFRSHSLKANYLLKKLDYFGILIQIFFASASYYYYIFFDHQKYMWIFMAILSLGTLGTFIAIFNSAFGTPKYKILRAIVFGVLGFSNVVPVLFAFYLIHYSNETIYDHTTGLFYAVLEGAFYGLGLYFYVSKFPEKKYPKKFDIFFNSHSIWHICVFMGTFSHYNGNLRFFRRYESNLID